MAVGIKTVGILSGSQESLPRVLEAVAGEHVEVQLPIHPSFRLEVFSRDADEQTVPDRSRAHTPSPPTRPGTTTNISQADLWAYLRQVAELGGLAELRFSIVDRLRRGASVEPGPLSAQLVAFVSRLHLTFKMFARAVGNSRARRLWNQMQTTTYRRLCIRDQSGNYLGWHEHLNRESWAVNR